MNTKYPLNVVLNRFFNNNGFDFQELEEVILQTGLYKDRGIVQETLRTFFVHIKDHAEAVKKGKVILELAPVEGDNKCGRYNVVFIPHHLCELGDPYMRGNPQAPYMGINDAQLADILSAYSLTQIHPFPSHFDRSKLPQGLELIALIQERLRITPSPRGMYPATWVKGYQRHFNNLYDPQPFNPADLAATNQNGGFQIDIPDPASSKTWPRMSMVFDMDVRAPNSLSQIGKVLLNTLPPFYIEEIMGQIAVAITPDVHSELEKCHTLCLWLFPYDALQESVKEQIDESTYAGWFIAGTMTENKEEEPKIIVTGKH